jgi:CubicO group peptidase (beta-lactamase class C family)
MRARLPRRTWLPGRHVRVYPIEEVESRNAAAEEPALPAAAVARIWEAALGLYRTGLHPALALCLRVGGRVVLDRALGHLWGNAPDDPPDAPRRRARHDSLFGLFSASKTVTAMLALRLAERGQLALDRPVADLIPGFARHGKERITLRHLLEHRAGLPSIVAPVDVSLLSDRARVVELLCDARPAGPPGRLAYHALSSGYLVAAAIEAAGGADLRELLAREITGPLGLRALGYGVAPAALRDVAQNAFTGVEAVPPASWMFRRSVGVSPREAAELSNHEAFLTGVVPSGNVIGTADEVCRLFQALLDGGAPVLAPETVARAVAPGPARLEIDASLGFPIRYGLGFMLGARRLSLYGADTTRAFGHIGFSNVVAWADPERDLACCLMTSGKPFITPGQLAWLNVARTISRVVPRRR